MPKPTLTAAKVQAITAPGKHHDSHGLYLNAKDSGAASWVLKYTIAGRQRSMGLGPLGLVSLAEARSKALGYRKQVLDGVDPLQLKVEKRTALTTCPTFREAAEKCIQRKMDSWNTDASPKQWRKSLEQYAYPIIGDLKVVAVTLDHVEAILTPIWSSKTETADRVRQRIENVLDWAKARKHCQGGNPARWRGNLDSLFSMKSEVRSVRHFRSLQYSDLASFMAKLRSRDCASARAIEFLILTVGRTSEITGGRKDEICDRLNAWIIPGSRMKASKEHRAPLSSAALAVLNMQLCFTPDASPYLFTSGQFGEPISNAAMYQFIKNSGYGQVTVHGFRSTFRNWAADKPQFSREVIEMALAHRLAKGSEASYWQSDVFEKRRQLMEAWAVFCR